MSRTLVAAICAAFLLIGSASAQSPDVSEGWWAAVGSDGTQRVNVRCGTNFLDPASIVVKANLPVVLAITTESNLLAHNFSLQLPGVVNIDAPVGPARREFRFALGIPGSYVLACRDANKSAGAPPEREKQGRLSVVP